MKLDWLKKSLGSAFKRTPELDRTDASVPLSTQCKLLKVTRSVIYEQKKRLQKATDKGELVLLRLPDEGITLAPILKLSR
jgi:urease accessory protein UreE